MKTQRIDKASVVLELEVATSPWNREPKRFSREVIKREADEIMAQMTRHCDLPGKPYLHWVMTDVCSECGAEWSDDGSECRESCQDGAVRRDAQ